MAFQDLSAMGIGLVVFIVILSVVGIVITELDGQTDADTTAKNITNIGGEAVQDFVDWTPIIVVAVVGSLIIGLVMRFMGTGRTTA